MPGPLLRLGAVGLVLGVAVSGCGGSAPKAQPSASPSAQVSVPAGVTLTKPGAKLSFGQTATVPYVPNSSRRTVLGLTVESVERARMSDFAAYELDARTQASTPYYVRVKVTNLGQGDVGGTGVPLWAVDQSDTLIHTSGFTNPFKPCPSPALPADFGAQASESTCLVYLVPDHGTLTSVSFRPEQSVAGIEWTGTISTEKATKPAKKHKKSAKGSKAKG